MSRSVVAPSSDAPCTCKTHNGGICLACGIDYSRSPEGQYTYFRGSHAAFLEKTDSWLRDRRWLVMTIVFILPVILILTVKSLPSTYRPINLIMGSALISQVIFGVLTNFQARKKVWLPGAALFACSLIYGVLLAIFARPFGPLLLPPEASKKLEFLELCFLKNSG